MTRPTQEGLVHAQHLLSVLACDPATEDAYHDLAALIAWQRGALEEARHHGSYGPGGQTNTIGRHAVTADLSGDYCRASMWRGFASGNAGKALSRTMAERQGSLL